MHDANDQPAAFLFFFSRDVHINSSYSWGYEGREKERIFVDAQRPSVRTAQLARSAAASAVGHATTTEGRELASDLTSQLSVPYESLVTTLLMFRLVDI